MAQTPIAPAWTRASDIAIAVVALFVASPLVLLIAICMRLFLGKPVLFRQVRPGLGGRPFPLHKFPTMRLQSQSGDLNDAPPTMPEFVPFQARRSTLLQTARRTRVSVTATRASGGNCSNMIAARRNDRGS